MLPYDSNTVKPCNLSQAEVRSDTAQVFRAPPEGKMPAQAPHSGSSFFRLLQLYPRILSAFKREIIVFVPVCVRYKDKCNTILFFKASHKLYLMLMYIGKGKRVGITFFCIKAYRDSLYSANIVDRTLLLKISQCNVSGFRLHLYRCNRSGNLLYERQAVLPVFSFVLFIMSSKVEPLKPLEFQVAISFLSSLIL